jgi:protein-disulfide isomerase
VKINLRSVLAGILLVVILAGVVFFVKRNRPVPVEPASEVLTSAGYRPVLKTLGSADAPIKIVEYSDFECPSCRFAQQELRKIMDAYPGKIQIVYKHFPLSSNRWSIYAHQAAECMNDQGKFWPYQEMLYNRQFEWAPLPGILARI